jgi:diguanylate cyclase (GGDEF)-like protein
MHRPRSAPSRRFTDGMTGPPVLGRLWTRLARGPLFIVAAVAVCLVAIPVVRAQQNGTRDRAIDQEVLTAKTIIALSVDRNITELEYRSGVLTAQKRADLNGDLVALQQSDRAVGLEVWGLQGQLLYADPQHPQAEQQLPANELRLALRGKPFVLTGAAAGRGISLLEVFQIADPNRNGAADGVIEVLLPDSKVESAVASSSRQLYAIAFVAIALMGWALLVFRHRLNKREFEAEHDPLTGLGNRALLARRGATLDRRDGQAAQGDDGRALLLVDLDGFKRVNDALGHPVGDDVLVAVAGRLRGAVRAGDELVRVGGDEFALLVDSIDPDEAERIAGRMLDSLREPVSVGAISVQIGASVGIARSEADIDVHELFRAADVAMYQAKGRGGGIALYRSETDDFDVEHLALLGDVQPAISRNEFVLHYQPKVDPGRHLTGVETLVRWDHPTRGLLAPGTFIPLVEETALMKPLTAWIIRAAISQSAMWRASGMDIPIAVNVSPRTLIDPDFIPLVQEALAEHHLPGTSLTIEITETAILEDPERASSTMYQLRRLGVSVSIDDFGTGFTSLVNLKQLPISEIKIDRGFVQGVLDSSPDRAIVANTINLAHDLHIPVVAEGVETDDVWKALASLGCDQFQGFLFARPMPAADLDRWIAANAAEHPAVKPVVVAS